MWAAGRAKKMLIIVGNLAEIYKLYHNRRICYANQMTFSVFSCTFFHVRDHFFKISQPKEKGNMENTLHISF